MNDSIERDICPLRIATRALHMYNKSTWEFQHLRVLKIYQSREEGASSRCTASDLIKFPR